MKKFGLIHERRRFSEDVDLMASGKGIVVECAERGIRTRNNRIPYDRGSGEGGPLCGAITKLKYN